jgi:hypothetical protein
MSRSRVRPLHRPAIVLTMTEDYGKKVREIALLQCRCDTGADLETDLPKMADDEEPQAA